MSKTFKKMAVTAALTLAAAGAQAAAVGTYGVNGVTGLNALGNTVVSLSSLNAASLSTVDVLLLGRGAPVNAAIANFVANGGKLITEWSSAQYGMSLLGGVARDNYSSYRNGDTISMTAAGIALGLTSYSDSGSTEFFQDFLNLGSGTVYGTRGSNGATALVGGSHGKGPVWVAGYDWGDQAAAPTLRFLDSVIDAQIPEPTSLALAAIALMGLGFSTRRKSR